MISFIKKNSISFLFLGALLSLLVLSLVFSIERIISADTSDYLIKLVNEQGFYAGSYRFIAYFTQFIPLLFVHLNMPFNVVVQSYSFNLMLFHVLVIAIIFFYFKDVKTASIALLSLLLTSTYLFYYPVTELQMGLSLSFLLYSLVNHDFISKKAIVLKILIALFLFITVIYSHPLAISFVGFALVYLFLEKKFNFKIFIGFSALSILIFLSKYAFFTVENDSSNIEFLTYLEYFPKAAFLKFWGIAISKLYLFLAVVLISVLTLVKKRKWLHLIFFVVYFYTNFYFSLSKWGNGINWYSIHLCLPFFYIGIFVFVHELIHFKYTKRVLFFMLPLTIISLIQIPDNKKFNQERIAILDTYVNAAANKDIQKGYISPSDKGNSPRNWFWAIEYESLIWSKYTYNKTISVVYKNDEQIKGIDNQENLFLTVWGALPISYLNPNYFTFEPQTYQSIYLP